MLFQDRVNRYFASYGISRFSKHHDLFVILLSMAAGINTSLLNSQISFLHNTIKFRLNGITQQDIEVFSNFLIKFCQDPQELKIEIKKKLTDEGFGLARNIRRTTLKELMIESIKNLTNKKLFYASFSISENIIYEKIFPYFVFYFNGQFKSKSVQNVVDQYYKDEGWNLYKLREDLEEKYKASSSEIHKNSFYNIAKKKFDKRTNCL